MKQSYGFILPVFRLPVFRLVLPMALAVMFLGLLSTDAEAAKFNHTSATQAVLLDHETGQVLFEKEAHDQMPTSSMSKVLTMYLVFEALEDGRLMLETELPVSEKAWRKGGSKMFIEVGKRVKVEDLIRGVIIQSGNDATIALAEGLAGSEDAFAEAMNTTADALGMTNSNFVNASGWPDPEHYSTAYDLVLLGRRLIVDFPQYYHYYAEKEFTYNNITQRNRNPLLYRDMGADGIKTGHTEVGGYGLMASGERDGRRVILVINGLEDKKARAQEGARLLEWGLKGFENKTLFTAGEIVEYVPVVMGKKADVPLVIDRDLKVTLPVALRNDLKVSIVYDSPVIAPVREGHRIGTLKVEIPRGETYEVPLKAGEPVESLGFIAGTFSKIRLMLNGGKTAP